ncbi:Cytochrome P450-33C9 [Aphelenchoides fujianensis]|nr:Cytochrome P450-33C9 [Aphelenchoides fujianensis]
MIALLLLLAVVWFFVYHFHLKRRNLPPGPTPLPPAGNLHKFRETGDEQQAEWHRQYGDVFTLWMGKEPMVVVADHQLMVDAFVKDGEAYVGRGVESDFQHAIRGGPYGIILGEGDSWREQRRFALHVLRDFGLGKNLMQEKILEEVETLCDRVSKQALGGADVDIADLIDISVGSIINCVMFSYRYDTEERLAEFHDLRSRARHFMAISGNPLFIAMRSSGQVNIFKHLPVLAPIYREAHKAGNYLVDFFRQRAREYEEMIQRNPEELDEEPSDYVRAFLQEQRKQREAGNTDSFTQKQLVCNLFDLWIAGQETTSNTIGWGLAYLIHNPRLQERLHEELDRVVGSDRPVTLADKPELPLFCAFVNETQRIANLVPINVIHKTTRDVRIGKFAIKKNTWIVPQVSILLYDPNVFEDPKIFNPDRFLDENGRLKKVDELLPFSLGKRACLGEGLARMELFLFMVNLLNRFKLHPSDNLPCLERRMGVTVRPEDFKCRMERRYAQ